MSSGLVYRHPGTKRFNTIGKDMVTQSRQRSDTPRNSMTAIATKVSKDITLVAYGTVLADFPKQV